MTVHTVNVNEDGLTRRQDLSNWIKKLQSKQKITSLKKETKKSIFQKTFSEIEFLRNELDNLKKDIQLLKNVFDLKELIFKLDKRVNDLELQKVSFASSHLLNVAAEPKKDRKSIFKKIIKENVELRKK